MSSFPAGRLVGEHLYVMRYSLLPSAVNFSLKFLGLETALIVWFYLFSFSVGPDWAALL